MTRARRNSRRSSSSIASRSASALVFACQRCEVPLSGRRGSSMKTTNSTGRLRTRASTSAKSSRAKLADDDQTMFGSLLPVVMKMLLGRIV